MEHKASGSAAAAIGTHSEARNILLVAGDVKQARALAQVLRCFAGSVEIAESLDTAPAKNFDLVIAGFGSLSKEDQDKLAPGAASEGRARLVLLSEARSRADFEALFKGPGLVNMVARNQDSELADLVVTVQKILRNDIFGIEKYFSWGVEPMVIRARRSDEKDALVATAERYATSLGINGRLVNQFCTVADELFTNAIYNAPTDASGKNVYAERSRTELVELALGKDVTIKFCCDGRRLGISVSDPYGSLRPEEVQGYLLKCFSSNGSSDVIEQGSGGAGLGLYYVFESLSHFIVNVAPGRQTEIIGLLDIRDRYREFAGRAKSFNMFVAER